jgi:hypothetical protein
VAVIASVGSKVPASGGRVWTGATISVGSAGDVGEAHAEPMRANKMTAVRTLDFRVEAMQWIVMDLGFSLNNNKLSVCGLREL